MSSASQTPRQGLNGGGLFGRRGRSATTSATNNATPATTTAAGTDSTDNGNKNSTTSRPAVGAGALRLLGAGMQRLEMGLEDLGAVLSDEADRHKIDGHRLAALRGTVQTSVYNMNEPEAGRISRLRSTVGETASKVGKGVRGVTQSAVQTASTASERVLQHQQSSSLSLAHSDDLESLRRRMQDEQQVLEAETMSREAEEACLNVCRRHLHEFLQETPDGTYEDWLRSLHPENDYEGKLLEGFSELDHRFFVKESDHLKMWNESVDEEIKNKEGSSDGEVKRQKVEARYRLGGHEEDTCTVDLLDMGGVGSAGQNDTISGGVDNATYPTHTNSDPLDSLSRPVEQKNNGNAVSEGEAKSTTPNISNGKASELLLDFKGSKEEKKTTTLVYDEEHDILDDIDLL
mmetsp:Transcript_16738/g.48045  ORF Transcript_16738/g.48045 Transcript_16738/m.48045 type:complete len:404 (+) Transcript_16738:94-1305(+)|eukprot:CAMPEP_0181039038 /NCGR_PEP_ID=MMETSP1070-20121207/10249_1 /TAXON_ID=265543 /ORGANISM="Minutocellus polymorphus, Strain NH13" /LENGTH=403 /DNA_ID=CAMNT_0023116849 /DNA_START=83 /DNA_END=1294 /DNA_ORIENTATION=-